MKPDDNELRRTARDAALGQAKALEQAAMQHLEQAAKAIRTGDVRWHQIPGPKPVPNAQVFQGEGDGFAVCVLRVGDAFRGSLISATPPHVVVIPAHIAQFMWEAAAVQWN